MSAKSNVYQTVLLGAIKIQGVLPNSKHLVGIRRDYINKRSACMLTIESYASGLSTWDGFGGRMGFILRRASAQRQI